MYIYYKHDTVDVIATRKQFDHYSTRHRAEGGKGGV